MPTLRAAAGADYPADFAGRTVQPEEGVNLLPVFNGESLSARTLFFEHQAARGIIDGDWKAVWGKRMPSEIDWELYDLSEDRTESTNLAGDHSDTVRQLADKWAQYAERTGIAVE